MMASFLRCCILAFLLTKKNRDVFDSDVTSFSVEKCVNCAYRIYECWRLIHVNEINAENFLEIFLKIQHTLRKYEMKFYFKYAGFFYRRIEHNNT